MMNIAFCQEDRHPDPKEHALTAVFWCFTSNVSSDSDAGARRASYQTGIIVLDDGSTKISRTLRYAGLASAEAGTLEFVDDELSLFRALEEVVLELDPDVLTSFELQNDGWGYISARYKHEFGGGKPSSSSPPLPVLTRRNPRSQRTKAPSAP